MATMTIDGNMATAYVSYALTELAIIYPITPSSPMAELMDEWAANGRKNAFGQTVRTVQMQSESGVAGALHGALTCGALATSFTCSQGLLLMQPAMYKIAGELLPTVLHVSARALATHALSIFGDHQDVMACRQTGFAFLCASSVQEAHDFALITHAASLAASVPFVHFFDGFRTSHEYQKIDVLSYEDIGAFVDGKALSQFRARALHPSCPMQRGTAQNEDIYFQNREACNPYYQAVSSIVQDSMDKLVKMTGRAYRVFDYYGAKDAKRVIVAMGSACQTAEETIDELCRLGEKVGLVKVRLFRPFDVRAFQNALPKTCEKIAVLDRTKECGSVGEPLYLDVCAALDSELLKKIRVVGGRYGLGMKDFTPSCCYAVFEHLKADQPKHGFTVGILDDVTGLSLPLRPFSITRNEIACKFFGLGSDGTVGANKNSIQILGEHTSLYVQGYFQYDSKKSGGTTVSHLRISPSPIRSAYPIEQADFIACHTPSYLTRLDILASLKTGGTVLLNCPCTELNELNAYLPPMFKCKLARKQAVFYVIDGTGIAKEVGLNGKHSTVMQAAFFALQENLIPYEQATAHLKSQLLKRFSRKGEDVVEKNILAIDLVKDSLRRIEYPSEWAGDTTQVKTSKIDNGYFRRFMQPILSLQGNSLPVSAFQADGTVPTDTAQWEKRGAAASLPKWIAKHCIQCNQCSFVCPHACIRPFIFLESSPNSCDTIPAIGVPNGKFRIQVSPNDCLGCGICAHTCPAKVKALVMTPADGQLREQEENWTFALQAQHADVSKFPRNTVKGSQFYPPLFEFSYACAGCGETPYVKVLTQLCGENLIIANATGCSSIYGGSAPSCPYAKNKDGRGPAWANSLFEDNAEFGLGMVLAQRGNKDAADVWCIGGDGWAYDIGYGGLDHVLASKEKIRILVLDSQVYSNTGGQYSKATPRGATARFAVNGNTRRRKDLALMAMTYQTAYVAQVCLGADKQQLINAYCEANAFDGPALIIAYSPCIAHGFSMQESIEEEKRAVACGFWHLFRFNPNTGATNENPLRIDSAEPSMDLSKFWKQEKRFATMTDEQKEIAKKESKQKLAFLKHLQEYYNK